eukprot:CAMPEP_0118972582 /NCGR_PEP_ID=MMETSP1173-20130426/8850_1 /TAXON_ID=1034831 /ORGANISM="Rhizochromulina marina cf, Strain CCMP1243" /LENGTH=565 /DNA_ID=CAMNT_0006922139 /DNA_START=107 /DNA_END=1801 /DNA_ORIENTATION=-
MGDRSGGSSSSSEEEEPLGAELVQVGTALYSQACQELGTRGGDAKEAELLLTGSLESFQSALAAPEALAEAAASDGETLDEALHDIKTLLAEVQVLLGRVVEWKHPDKSRKMYEEATQHDPSSAAPRLELARLLWRNGTSASELQRSQSLLTESLALAREARDEEVEREAGLLLARLHSQQPGHQAETHAVLRSLGGFTWTLAPFLTSTDWTRGQPPAQVHGPAPPGSVQPLFAFDSALPGVLLSHMKWAFRPGAAFWRHHEYDGPRTGFFSYQHSLPPPVDGITSPASSLDQVILHLQRVVAQKVPRVAQARFAEWWAHSRPHSNGHRLHYDYVDDGEGKPPRHPICSTVLFVTADCGGPTLVLDQTVAKPTTSMGWLVRPSANRVACFDGRHLHAVMPGVGLSPAGGSARRLTFMVAFWEDDPRAPPFPYPRTEEGSGTQAQTPTKWVEEVLRPLRGPRVDKAELGLVRDDEVLFLASIVEAVEDDRGSSPERPRTKRARLGRSKSVDLLDDRVFAPLTALNSGINLAEKGECSLNCGGKCPACLARCLGYSGGDGGDDGDDD